LKIMMNHQWRRSAGAFVCLCSMTPIGLTSTPAQTPAPADQASQVSAPAIAETRLTLQSAVDRAVANYPTVRIALQKLLAAKESVGLTRTQYLPQANVLWQTNRSTYNNIPGLLMPQGVIPVLSGTVLANTSGTSVWGSAGGLLMNWEPTRFGYRKAEVAAAQAGSNSAGDRLALTKLDVSSAAASAYLTVATLHEQVKSAQADLLRRETFAKTIHVLADSQLRPGADASEADAEVAASRTRLIQAQTQEKVSLAALAELLVLPSSQITLNSDSLLVADASTDVPAFAAASHPWALEQSHLLDQTKSVEQVWSRAYSPRFSLEGAVSGRGSGVKPDGTLLACIIHEHIVNSFLGGTRLPNTATAA
jgi:outer membrane protein TolC